MYTWISIELNPTWDWLAGFLDRSRLGQTISGNYYGLWLILLTHHIFLYSNKAVFNFDSSFPIYGFSSSSWAWLRGCARNNRPMTFWSNHRFCWFSFHSYSIYLQKCILLASNLFLLRNFRSRSYRRVTGQIRLETFLKYQVFKWLLKRLTQRYSTK